MQDDIRLITHYFPHLSATQQRRLADLKILISEWNEKINLISRKDIANLEERHILHSLSIAKIIHFQPGTQLLDVGTGGGFPGLPLAVLFPDSYFTLVDSVGKKIKVVNDIIRQLEMKNVVALHERAENLSTSFDFITGRGVTDINIFWGWIKNKIAKKQKNALPNGVLYLKGGELKEELKSFKKRADIFSLSDFFQEEYFQSKSIIYISG